MNSNTRAPTKVKGDPLHTFPAKYKELSDDFFYPTLSRRLSKIERLGHWLHSDDVDPEYGVEGDGQQAYIRRTFRRLGSSSLFLQSSAGSSSTLSQLHTPVFRTIEIDNHVVNEKVGRQLLVVDQSRFEDLTKVENTLRDEKKKIGEQCVLVMSTGCHLNLHTPTPAARLAMHNLCEAEMRNLACGIYKLNKTWRNSVEKSRYNRHPSYTKNSHVKAAPIPIKVSKLHQFYEYVDDTCKRRERENMMYEDDLSRLVDEYYGIKSRKIDYDRYYILASRYGAFEGCVFYQDDYPGLRYYTCVTNAAIGMQKLWIKFWSVRKNVRYNSAMIIQKSWRRRWCRLMWMPLIKLRMKMGKRTYYILFFKLWRDYQLICRLIKKKIAEVKKRRLNLTFGAWASFSQEQKKRKAECLRRFVNRIKYGTVTLCFVGWKQFTSDRGALKLRMRRTMQNPHFGMWVRYVEWSKYIRSLHLAAQRLQAKTRMRQQLKRYKIMQQALSLIRPFCVRFHSFLLVKKRRAALTRKEYMIWKPDEICRQAARSNEKEKSRLIKLTAKMKDVELKVTDVIKEHLRSIDGQLQVKSMSSGAVSPLADYQELQKQCQRAIIKRAIKAHHTFQYHDFNARMSSIPIHCADPKCQGSFTTLEQYHVHFAETRRHNAPAAPQFAEFHFMLNTPHGQECIHSFIKDKNDTYIVHSFEFHLMMIDFKRHVTGTKAYKDHLGRMYEMFIADSCTHPLSCNQNKGTMHKRLSVMFSSITSDLDDPIQEEIGKIKKKLETLIYTDLDLEEEFFQPSKSEMTALRTMFGKKENTFSIWTEEHVFLPSDIDELAWQVFLKIFNYLVQNTDRAFEFKDSTYYAIYQNRLRVIDCEIERKMERNFVEYRKSSFREWTKQFMAREDAMFEKAGEVVNVYVDTINNKMIDETISLAIYDEVRRRRTIEQKIYESMNMTIDEALSWVTINLWDEIFTYTVPPLVDSMLVMDPGHPYIRASLLKYSETMNWVEGGGSLMIDLNRNNGAIDMFKEMFDNDEMVFDDFS